MDILYWTVIGYTGVNLAGLILAWWLLSKSDQSVKTSQSALLGLIRQRDLQRALKYCNDQPALPHIEAAKILLLSASRPYMIPLVTDVAMYKMKPYGVARKVSRVMSLLTTCGYLALSYMVYSFYPDLATMKTCAGLILLLGAFFQLKLGNISTLQTIGEEFVLSLRNELLLMTNHIPPMYRNHPGTPQEIDLWRRSILEIERDVLVGMDPVDAHNAAVKRVTDLVESASYTPQGDLVQRLPTGKLDLLSEE